MEKVRWRGTWGIGDSMQALNACHNYAHTNGFTVNLEMHWSHGENYFEHPKDPETIVERTNWIHTQYHNKELVNLTHVFNSDLFPSGNVNPDKQKARFYFDSNAYDPNGGPPNDWIFKAQSFTEKKRKIVIWTPTYNSKPPRKWKRFLTNDDWCGIIKLLSWEGWNTVELTYRTPIKDAFKEISEADFIVCYDGMWHLIARNFAKPMLIPSWEGVTAYNTPQAVKLRNRESFLEFIGDGNEHFTRGLTHMKRKARGYEKIIKKFYED